MYWLGEGEQEDGSVAPQDSTESPFDISIDDKSGAKLVTVRGFWSEAVFGDFIARMRESVPPARARDADRSVLIDASTLSVQSATSVANFAGTVASLARPEDRTAVVVSSTLVKMQFERVLNVARTRYFATVEEAGTWLRS